MEGCGDVGEPGCDGREYRGGDNPTTQPTEPATRDAPASQRETGSPEPAAAAPLAVWPSAAGGGAAAVAALILPARAYPADEPTLEPETAPAETMIEPPRSEALSPDEPEPHEPDRLAEVVQQRAETDDARTSKHALEPAQPAVPTLQSQPPAIDAPSATLPPLPVAEPRLEGVAAAAPPIALSPRPSVSGQPPAPTTPWREVPRQPPAPAKVEAPRYLRLALKLAAAVLFALAGSVLLLV